MKIDLSEDELEAISAAISSSLQMIQLTKPVLLKRMSERELQSQTQAALFLKQRIDAARTPALL